MNDRERPTGREDITGPGRTSGGNGRADVTPPTPEKVGTPRTFYDEVGGAPTFHRITAAFYAEVAKDDILRPMYPEEDLGPAERRLRMFLEQYWGGPRTYSEERGHPRLRMRHAPYVIGPIERDAWLRCMRVAIGSIDDETLDAEHRRALLDYMDMAAQTMVNAPL